MIKNHTITKETHGRSDDIDEDTAVDDVKGPNVFERVKEEVEAIVGAIHPKKESKGPPRPERVPYYWIDLKGSLGKTVTGGQEARKVKGD
ncbi:hypothetical protein GOBAR_DD13805 [Gossypium barbadense]|nr:hypothetical protein GOBAR_DD13805 [Gossypium barbadense]